MIALLLAASVSAAEAPKLPVLSDAEAWARLPAKDAKPPALPRWARMLASPMPKTAAKMLELDRVQRDKNPLGAALAAKVLWVAADALESPAGLATANFDLSRAGVIPANGRFQRPKNEPADEAAILDLARKLTRAAYTVTDEEFADVLRILGPEKTVALAHTVAYANFHNRILLGLGAETDVPPLPPIGVAFGPDGAAAAPARSSWAELSKVETDGPAVSVKWTRGGFDDLTRNLDAQKARKLRIPLPDIGKMEGLAPREREQAEKILWNTVSTGYQPHLTRAWFACLGAFYEESKVDRVFTNSMFWVVTRTNDCFY